MTISSGAGDTADPQHPTNSQRRGGKLKFGALELGRGFAAAFVVFHHAGHIMREPRFYGAEPFGGHFNNFNVGVDFFFVLSGFIIAWIHWGDLGNAERIGNYARKRFLRIFPPYWGVLIPLVLLYMLFPRAGDPSQHDPGNVLLSVLLLPNPQQPVLGVAWTLTYEIFFYLLFGIAIAGGRRFLLILPVWATAIVATAWISPLPFPLSFLLSPFNLEFILGVAAAAILRHRDIPAPGWLAGAGTALFLASMLFATNIQALPILGRLAFGVPAMMFVLGTVELERRRPLRLPKAAARFGAASYAIYLIHPVALSGIINLSVRVGGRGLPLDLVVLLVAAVAIAVGIAYNILVEPRLVAAAARAIRTGPALRPVG